MNKIFQSVAALTAGVLVTAALTAGAVPAFAEELPPETGETTTTEIVVDETVPTNEDTTANEEVVVPEEVIPEEAAPEIEVADANVPGEITNLAVSVNQLSATATWNAATVDGGDADAIRYQVIVSSDTEVANTFDTAETTITVNELVAFSTYNITVIAYNEAGESQPVISSDFVAGDSAPNAVYNLKGLVASGNSGLDVNVTWEAENPEYMADDVTYIVDTYNGSTLLDSATLTDTNYTVSGVVSGTTVTINVTAVFNEHASELRSINVLVQPTVPGYPTLNAYNEGTTIYADWTTPNDGGSAITGYIFEILVGNEVVVRSELGALFHFRTTPGLAPNTAFTVKVTAINAIGAGEADQVTVVTPVIVPTAARNVTYANGAINWTAPTSNGGEAVSYAVSVFNSAQELVESGDVTTTSYALTETYPVGDYTVSVTASNSAGEADAATGSFTKIAVPSAPTSVKLAVSSTNSLTGTWNAPVSGTGITKYIVELINVTAGTSTVVETTATSANFTNLAADSEFTFTVKAVNDGGTSLASAAADSVFTAPAALSDPLTEEEAKEIAANTPISYTLENGIISFDVSAEEWYAGVAYSTPTALGWVYSSATGRVSFDVSSLPAGNHTFLLYNAAGNVVGGASFAIAGAVTGTGTTTGALASTGVEVVGSIAIAVFALLAGAALLIASRRRRVAVTVAN